MKKALTTLLVLWLGGVVAAIAATRDAEETWDSGQVEGWNRHDALNARALSLTNSANYLEIVFDSQSKAMPQVHIVRADAGASGGAFAADYWSAGITNISFNIYCESNAPGDLRLYFYNDSSKNWWYHPLSAPTVGEWTHYSVPFEYWAGWRLGIGGNAAGFKQDLRGVEWVGVQIQRNAVTERQVYGLDNFVVYGADEAKDTDGDGANDWHEFLAGTSPNDPDSSLKVMEIAPTNALQGIVLRWRSAGNRTYAIPRSTNLAVGFTTNIATGIVATPPLNVYVDETATNAGPHYYKIEVEE